MRVPILALAASLLAAPVAAQDSVQHHMADMPGSMSGAMERMQHGMAIPATGDIDVDFARMMIPHHQGAIDMAKAELAEGEDPELRRLAEAIITAQEKEIAFLKQWLADHGHEP
jgi:uncharacterized protein (DUF305 family)